MNFMICIKFPKRWLQLIFEMWSLRIFDNDARIKTERFILMNDIHHVFFFFFIFSFFLWICKNFLKKIVWFDGTFRRLKFCLRNYSLSSYYEILLILLNKRLSTSWSKSATQEDMALLEGLDKGLNSFKGS
jgi:hypothetical protein